VIRLDVVLEKTGYDLCGLIDVLERLDMIGGLIDVLGKRLDVVGLGWSTSRQRLATQTQATRGPQYQTH
jgi:hypothetical protein